MTTTRQRDYEPTLRDEIEVALSSAATQVRLGFSDTAWDTFCRCATETIQSRLRGKIMDDDLKFDGATLTVTQVHLLRIIGCELRQMRRLLEAQQQNGKSSPSQSERKLKPFERIEA
jgi:hypothetical protein